MTTTNQPTTAGSSRAVVAIAATAAAIPTILSAQGQIALWHDVVHLDTTAAVAFACFLETALVASALMARQAIQRGGAGRTDLTATWILSLLSGVLAGAHDVVTRHGDTTSVVALSAVARVVAPLVACWLWHRVVVGDRDDTATSWRDARQQRHVLAVAVAAQRARGGDTTWRRVLDWRGRRLLRVTGDSDVTSDLHAALRRLDDIAALPDTDTSHPMTRHDDSDTTNDNDMSRHDIADTAVAATPTTLALVASDTTRRDTHACDTTTRHATATLPITINDNDNDMRHGGDVATTRHDSDAAVTRQRHDSDDIRDTARRLVAEHGATVTGEMLHDAIDGARSLRTCQRILRELTTAA